MHRLSEQMPELVRGEMRLAQAELTQKGKKAGVGVGLFSVAGLLALLRLRPRCIATAVLALALVLPAWLAALIVDRRAVRRSPGSPRCWARSKCSRPPLLRPESAMASVQEDKAAVKGAHA